MKKITSVGEHVSSSNVANEPLIVKNIPLDEVEIASMMFAEIFKNDPFYLTILREDKNFPTVLQKYFKIAMTISVPNNQAFQVNSYLGGALFFPPTAVRVSFLKQMCLLPKLLTIFRNGMFFKILSALNNLQNEQPKQSHFYLFIFGRKDGTDFQHKGIATAAVTPTLNLCDQLGLPCYAEFTTDHSAEVGEKLGFNIIKEKKFMCSEQLILRLGIRHSCLEK